MPAPFVIDVNSLDDPRDAVHRAVQGLAEGRLVVLPTETTYCFAASALQPEVVQHIAALRETAVLANSESMPVIALKSAGEALDFVPEFSSLTKRLVRRCWPGPLHLRLCTAHQDSALGRIPPAVRKQYWSGSVPRWI
jgi:protein-tyrosine phosphatase